VLKKVFDFFIFTSLFIAICAVLMVYQTGLLFNIPTSFALLAFVFSGSVCSYNFHWYLTPPNIPGLSPKLKWNINNRNVHLVLFIISLIAAGVFSLLLIEHWLWLGVTAFLTFLYSAPKIPYPIFIQLRKIAIAKTIFLAFAWAHITALLPIVIAIKGIRAEHIWFVVNRFFFIYAICIVFDRRDVEKDREAGIKSLITFLDEKGVDILFWCVIAVFAVTSVVLLQWFSLLIIIALLIPAIILCFLYYPSKKNFSDYLYYFILDGLMMLSAPLLILIKFAR
jgi:4-hydroxybenzoate polyprenyltransferase